MKKPKWADIERASRHKAHQAQIAEFEKRIKRHAEIIEQMEVQLGVVSVIRQSVLPTAALRIEASKPKGESVAVAVASDWHVEESVDPKTINHLNEFNLGIANERIERFFRGVIRLAEIERAGTDINTLVLVLGGDLMTGYIHEELREENELSPTETILWLQERLAKGINTLRKHFPRIVIPCCYGNHGRTTIKPRHSTGAKNSYEWLLYSLMSQRITDGVEWHVADGYHTFLDVYGSTFRIHHGDGLKYQGGIGGLTIPVEKAIASWNKARVADLDIFGHWHTSQQNPKWIANGSLIGFNAYSVAIKAAFEQPCQTFFLWDVKMGRTGTWPIYLKD